MSKLPVNNSSLHFRLDSPFCVQIKTKAKKFDFAGDIFVKLTVSQISVLFFFPFTIRALTFLGFWEFDFTLGLWHGIPHKCEMNRDSSPQMPTPPASSLSWLSSIRYGLQSSLSVCPPSKRGRTQTNCLGGALPRPQIFLHYDFYPHLCLLYWTC